MNYVEQNLINEIGALPTFSPSAKKAGINDESEPLMRRARESLSVRYRLVHSDEHSAKRYVRSGLEHPLAPEHRDKPGASSYRQGNRGNSEVM